MTRKRWAAVAAAVSLTAAPLAYGAGTALDWGLQHERETKRQSEVLFGIDKPLASSARGDIDATVVPAADQVKLADGLRAEKVTDVAELGDMIAFWPSKREPRAAYVCVEQGRAEDGMNPGLQRVNLASGRVRTVVYGTDRCDGIRRTPWGTILFTEEADDGRAYELLRPGDLSGAPYYVEDRATGQVTGDNVVQRRALGTFAWEGLHVFADGTVIAGDELRPEAGLPGGSIFRFTSTVDSSSTDSPLSDGVLEALQVAGGPGEVDFGQGAEVGVGQWVRVDADTARASAHEAHATGYYRPEDLHRDPLAVGRRLCWTNTGNADLHNYGEVLCLQAGPRPEVQRLILGNPEMNQPDNLEFQPKTGIVYVIEDNDNGDVWACLRDGKDTDLLSDGCVRVLSVRDADAEPTGFIFDATGKTAYLHIQHNDEPATDPMLRITGWSKP